MVFSSLQSGFSWMWRNKRIVLFFYLSSLLFGVILMLPVRSALSQFIGSSLMGKELGGLMNMDFLFEFLTHNKIFLPVMTGIIGGVAVLYWLTNLFLSGGTFALVVNKEDYTAVNFWGYSAKYFGRFFRLFFVSLPLLMLFLLIPFIETGLQRLIFGSDPYQYITYWGGWIKIVIRAFAILFYMIIFDYARIYTVATDEKRMRRAIWEGLSFTWKNIGTVFMLAFSIALIGYLSLFIYNPVANALSAPSGYVIFILFLVQQLYIFFRMMVRVTLYSSEVFLYGQLLEKSAPKEGESPEDMEPGEEIPRLAEE